MTDQATKKRTVNRSSPLTATQAADRLAPLIGGRAQRIDDARTRAEHDEIAATRESVERIMGRVPEAERDKVARVLLALGCDLSGFELVPSNDAPSAADPRPDWLDEPAPAATRPIVVDRERKVPRQ